MVVEVGVECTNVLENSRGTELQGCRSESVEQLGCCSRIVCQWIVDPDRRHRCVWRWSGSRPRDCRVTGPLLTSSPNNVFTPLPSTPTGTTVHGYCVDILSHLSCASQTPSYPAQPSTRSRTMKTLSAELVAADRPSANCTGTEWI